MKWPILLLFLFLLSATAQAQHAARVHIVTTKDNRMNGFRLQCTINGVHYKLKPGTCFELQVNSDSLHILMTDTRWIKNETVDLHVKTDEEMYIHLLWGYRNTEKPRKIRAFAEAVCKACFDELKKKCRKTIAGND